MLEWAGMNIQLSSFNFFLLVLSTVILTAAGYIINDVNDVDADNINKPDKVIIGNYVSSKAAEYIYVFLNFIAIGLGIYVSYKIEVRFVSLAFMMVAALLYFYSTSYKGQLILGNIVVSAFAAIVPLMVLLFELPLLRKKYNAFELTSSDISLNPIIRWVAAFSVFAFLISLAREIVKDMEDIEGDSYCEIRTLPVAYGLKVSKISVFSILVIILLLVAYLVIFYLNDPISFFYITSFVILPLIYTTFLTLKAKEKTDYSKISYLCKLIMFTGIMYCVVVRFIFFD
jgi:4-hydroxybenzoate polyprenyltransferase